jgi:ribonuclease-3
MDTLSGTSLIDLLRVPSPDIDRIIETFVSRYNAAYGNPVTGRWDISTDDWQRYEFLGDRVLNLIIAQSLFSGMGMSLDEGEMTKILGWAVSNRSLDTLISRRTQGAIEQLIPPAIAGQHVYGERVRGGAFEALVGALYCEVGFDEVAVFVNNLFSDYLKNYRSDSNAIGDLQEYCQQRTLPLPVYEEVNREGPDHRPLFTYRVCLEGDRSFTGTGSTVADAKQDAALRALDAINHIHQE